HRIKKINKVHKAKKKHTKKLGRAPTLDELSIESNLSPDKIIRVKELKLFTHSVEDPHNEIGIPIAEYLEDDAPSPLEQLERREVSEKLRTMLSKLSPREEKIIRMRFGIGEKKPVIFRNIGKSFGISGERARKIFVRSLSKLSAMEAYFYEDDRAFLEGGGKIQNRKGKKR